MSEGPPLVVIDADVLGRHRTGDETYVEQLLRNLPALGPDLRYAAVTRHPELVPPGIEPIRLGTKSQEVRMAVRMPLLLRRHKPALAHFLHALPPFPPCPAIVTVQDISFENDPQAMPRKDRLVFKTMVPRAVRTAAAVLTISERSRDDIVAAPGGGADKVVATPLGVDPAFTPGDGDPGDYLLFVGAVTPSNNPLPAPLAAQGPAQHPGRVRSGGAAPRPPSRRRRPDRRRGARGQAPRARRRPPRLRLAGGARQPLPARPGAPLPLALRGIRPAAARGDGLRDARRLLARPRPARAGRRGRALRVRRRAP